MSLFKRIGLALVLAFSFFMGSAATAQAVEVCVPPLVCATVTVPVVSTVTDYVTKPAVTLPRQTVTKTVTNTVKVPEPVTTTDVVRLPGPTVTKTARNTVAGQTVTKYSTVTQTQTVTNTVTPTPVTVTKTVTVEKTRSGGVVTVDRIKTVGISLGLLLLGGLLTLLAMYITYAVGYKDSELESEKEAENLLNQLFSRKK